MTAFNLMNVFGKGGSKVKVKVKGLTFVVKVDGQQLTFDSKTKFWYRNPKLAPESNRSAEKGQNSPVDPRNEILGLKYNY